MFLFLLMFGIIGVDSLRLSNVDAKASNSTNSEVQESYKILPNNDRHQIIDGLNGHYQSVSFLNVNYVWSGTGVVIGKDTVLTNRHTLQRVKKPEDIRFAPARTSKTVVPFDAFEASDFVVNTDPEYDLAVVNVKPNQYGHIGDCVKPAVMEKEPDTSVGTELTITGYPQDKSFATMWESKGKSTRKATKRLYYDASTEGGNSGSPVFNKDNHLIGIHAGAVTNENYGVRIDSTIYKFIQEHMK